MVLLTKGVNDTAGAGPAMREAFGRCARLVAEADGLLVVAGAAMSVDSGLPDLHKPDIFARTFPDFVRAGWQLADLLSPAAFRTDPREAWGFPAWLLQTCRQARPHAGHAALLELAGAVRGGCFVVTSNVDGLFQQAGYAGASIEETHGSIHRLQCLAGCGQPAWSAADWLPVLDARPGLASAPPRCPRCGAVARPNMRLGQDPEWQSAPYRQQRRALDGWLSTVRRPLLIEIDAGAGNEAVRQVREGRVGHLIRIDPDEVSQGGARGENLMMGAQEALCGIARALRGLVEAAPPALDHGAAAVIAKVSVASREAAFEADQASMSVLTHVGLRRLQQRRKAGLPLAEEERVLARIEAELMAPVRNDLLRMSLIRAGWIEPAAPHFTAAMLRLRYLRNPLQHVERVAFGMDALPVPDAGKSGKKRAAVDMDALIDAAKLWLELGVRRFELTGRDGMLDAGRCLELIAALRAEDARQDWPAALGIALQTTGWFAGRHVFSAFGRSFAADTALYRYLAEVGVTHLGFSVAPPAASVEDVRHCADRLRRIIDAVPRMRACGIDLELSFVPRQSVHEALLLELAEAIHGPGAGLEKLLADSAYWPGAQCGNGMTQAGVVSAADLRCKAFFRPAPTLYFKADGELGVCPSLPSTEGYGRAGEHCLVGMLNHLHEAPLYRLHASHEIGRYASRIDPASLPAHVQPVCAARIVANRLALQELDLDV